MRRSGELDAKSRSLTASHGILAYAVHAERARDALAVERIAGAGQRRGAQRQAVGAPAHSACARRRGRTFPQASRWWPKLTGCATCRCVKPAGSSRRCASARFDQRQTAAPQQPNDGVDLTPRSHRRTSVATWSLRGCARCRRLPASPTSCVRRASMFRCTSLQVERPRERRPRCPRRSAPSRGDGGWSSCAMMPCAASIRRAPGEPAMSVRHSRRSKPTGGVALDQLAHRLETAPTSPGLMRRQQGWRTSGGCGQTTRGRGPRN